MKICKRYLFILLACFSFACADVETLADSEPEMESAEPVEPTTKENPGTEVQPAIELSESIHTLTLVARDSDGASLGAMVFELVDPLEGIENQNGAAEPQWFPIYVHGYFDVAELSDEEVDERAQAIADQIAYHPAASVIGCALRIAMAAALCMDGPAVVLTCPVGLHGVMCACGSEVGIKKADLAKFCDD